MGVMKERRRRDDGDRLQALKSSAGTRFNGLKDDRTKLVALKQRMEQSADFGAEDTQDVQDAIDWFDAEKLTL
ncbi:MAG: hypothetical protein ACYTBJ_16250 [Planctomycetota bacterium]|jgi:hypothetical protein